jgi:glycosyltransferase involved in cell wall biosynthesis
MRIGIDARLYTQTGVGRYLQNLILQLGQLDTKNQYIVYLRSADFDLFNCPNKYFVKKKLDIKWHSLIEQIIVPFILLKDNLDLVHFPYFNVPILYPKKYVITIHDLIIDHFDTGKASTLPLFLYKIKRMAYTAAMYVGIKRAYKIFVISQTTRKEVLEHYHPDSKNVLLTYDAVDDLFFRKQKILKPKKVISEPYILYIGNAYPHKNLRLCIDAYTLFLQTNKIKIKFILAGDDAYFYPRLKQYVKEKGMEKDIIFYGNANNDALINLYSHCLFLVFPSLMEGFGLPNFEVLVCNRLPVISDIPVFREIWKNDLPFFDPRNIHLMAEKMAEIYRLSAKDYTKKIQKAKKRLFIYTWKKTAQSTLETYNTITNQK